MHPHTTKCPRPGRSAFATLHSKRRLKLFSDTIKRWRRAFVYFGSAQNKRLCQAESHGPPTSGSVTQVGEDAPRRQTRTLTALMRLPGVPLSSTAPPRLATTRGAAEGQGEGGRRRDRARRHKARLERSRVTPGRPGNPFAARPHGAGGGRPASLPSRPVPSRADAPPPPAGAAASRQHKRRKASWESRAGRTRGRSAAARL